MGTPGKSLERGALAGGGVTSKRSTGPIWMLSGPEVLSQHTHRGLWAMLAPGLDVGEEVPAIYR
jgi:hypothetical protein